MVSLVVVQFVLSFTNPLCLAVDCDIAKAYNNATLCKATIKKQCSEEKFKELLQKNRKLASAVNCELSMQVLAGTEIMQGLLLTIQEIA